MAAPHSAALPPDRPVVLIFSSGPVSTKTLDPILWGLEEEGIPALQQVVPGGPVELTAKQAADLSPLGVGIGIERDEQTVVLHHRDLPAGRPLFRIGKEVDRAEKLRILGVNAAHLVKGDPLVFHAERRGCRQNRDSAPPPPSQWDLEQLTQLVASIVLGLLQAQDASIKSGFKQ